MGHNLLLIRINLFSRVIFCLVNVQTRLLETPGHTSLPRADLCIIQSKMSADNFYLLRQRG